MRLPCWSALFRLLFVKKYLFFSLIIANNIIFPLEKFYIDKNQPLMKNLLCTHNKFFING